MGTYTGTEGNDDISPWSYGGGGVATAPPGTMPGDGPDRVEGRGGSDELAGGGGDDWLDGGDGDDGLRGLDGDDQLYGGDGNDRLSGGEDNNTTSEGDNDILYGGSGDDRLSGEAADDSLFGEDGDDELQGGPGNDILAGGAGADTLVEDYAVGSGDDILDGGTGADLMKGSGGDDAYYVDDVHDVVTEFSIGGGVDTVFASVSFALSGKLEILVLTGAKALDGTGNGADNEIWGNKGANTLKGGNGHDFLFGDNKADTLKGGDGSDLLSGGNGNDTLKGGERDDLLYGYKGKDKLTGGAGADQFVFDTPNQGGDTITDFRAEDIIGIYAKGFGSGLKTNHWVSEAQFQAGATNHADDPQVRFVFRTTDETLWFDRNGSASGGLTLIADLQNGATLTADDIWLG